VRIRVFFVLVGCVMLFVPQIMAGNAPTIEQMRQVIQERGYTFDVAENPATERTMDQLCGLIIPPNWWKTAKTQELPQIEAVPASYDWRSYGGVSSVKDQGSCGSCWAFGTVGPLEAKIMIGGGPEEDLSEQYLVSCNDEGWGCSGGFFAHEYHRVDGAVYESCRPYHATDEACKCECWHPYKLTNWYYISGSNSVPPVADMKNAIYTYGPIGVAVYVDSYFQAYSSGIFNRNASGQPNHAVVLVGWNDTGNYWILKNSWGPGWGENGYMRIAYGSQMVGYAANYVTGYQAGDWPPDDDCDGGCTESMTSDAGILGTLDEVRSRGADSFFITFVDSFSRTYEREVAEMFAQNPMIYNLVQRGLWTNLHGIQQYLAGNATRATLDMSDFVRAAEYAEALAGRHMRSDLKTLKQMLEKLDGSPVSAMF
jgi:hypothetical protein